MKKIFKDDDVRKQFISFVGQIFYVGHGINSVKEVCFTMKSGRNTVYLLEMQMMWRLRQLLLPIINLKYMFEHKIQKLLDRGRIITIHIGLLYNISMKLKTVFDLELEHNV